MLRSGTEYRGARLADGKLDVTGEHSESIDALMWHIRELQDQRKERGEPELTHIIALTPITQWRLRLFFDRMDRFSFWMGFVWGCIAAMGICIALP